MTLPPKTLRRLYSISVETSPCTSLQALGAIYVLTPTPVPRLRMSSVIIRNLGSPSTCTLPRSCLTKVRPDLLPSELHPHTSVGLSSFTGLSLIYLGQAEQGMAELQDAATQKATEEHNVIDEAIRDRGEGYTVFSIVRPCFLIRYLTAGSSHHLVV